MPLRLTRRSWTLSKTFKFEAAHMLPFHDGKCQRLHGHSWQCSLFIGSNQLIETGSKQGMVMDYADIKSIFQPILDKHLDHWYLNDSLELASPTSEAVALWIYNKVKPLIPNLLGVEVKETCTSSCYYTEEVELVRLNSDDEYSEASGNENQ
jgi:6-pyruvoyltetrahydropterin/6-carboxytetrahydropterin synthase